MRAAHPRVVLGLHRSRHERSLLTAATDLGITAIDTSTNYLGFQSHKVLAARAADLLPSFTVSTKIGYFSANGTSEHSLEPVRLRAALKDVVRDLGREPDLVFLHNPEHSLVQASVNSALTLLGDACSVLADATARGLCGSWGISSWDPRPLTELVSREMPRPHVLMLRAGLLVGAEVLHAGEILTSRFEPSAVWGMSPFAGNTADPVWARFDPRRFLRAPERVNRAQAAFRVAFHLPEVSKLAVSCNSAEHLSELVESLAQEVDPTAVADYRRLLTRSRQDD
ncbi:aldo/keto reductase [Streptomyces microflavus]|jgi:aryl-alcohol dehydrogenase-like predicted oxidoreductase|uniref:aldo/keto reductase n=1 Tax=Streptomyces microflavus TaxID=1919 RepID=UPI00381C8782